MVEVAALAATAAVVLDSVAITAIRWRIRIRSQFRQPLVLALGPAEFDRDVQGLTGPALSASVGADVPR